MRLRVLCGGGDDVARDLEGTGLLVKSEGARVVFLDGYQTREGQPQPFIVQKSDGGFLYATTDIAAARHRCVPSPSFSRQCPFLSSYTRI